MSRTARAFWWTAPGRGELREEPLPEARPGEATLRAVCSGVSCGTERLVGLGLAPPDAEQAMRVPGMAGTFALPAKYGYCLAGDVEGGALGGKRAFAFHPHQDVAVVAEDALLRLPSDLPYSRATLLPNLETARNAVWDAELRGAQRVAVVGGGLVGVLVAWVLAREAGRQPRLCERDPSRRAAAAALPWLGEALAPEELPRGSFDLVFHATGGGDGLQLALDALAFEGTVVDLSWYGTRPVALRLGGDVHWGRKRIVFSQVAAVAPARRAGLTPRQRLAETVELLDARGEELDVLLGTPVPFADLPIFMAGLAAGERVPWAPLVQY